MYDTIITSYNTMIKYKIREKSQKYNTADNNSDNNTQLFIFIYYLKFQEYLTHNYIKIIFNYILNSQM